MPRGINKVILLGTVSGDVQTRKVASGHEVATFWVETVDEWTASDGTVKTRSTKVDVVAWGKLADLSARELGKGKQVYVEGGIASRSFEDRDGKTVWRTEVSATFIKPWASEELPF
jgi:single-strand DNA-binding protein